MNNKINFTKALLESAKAQNTSDRLVLLDAKTPGLQCRITRKGTATFSVYKRINGSRPERITLGKFPDMTVEQARIGAAKVNGSIAIGGNPAEVKRAYRGEMTFDELFAEYLEEYAKLRKRTWDDDECRYRLYLKKAIGSKKLSEITRTHIVSLHSSISKQTRQSKNNNIPPTNKTATANRVVALLSTIFRWGINNQKCSLNPATGIEKNPEKSRDRFLKPEELSSFFDAVKQETNKNIADYILLSLFTGARRASMVAMRWDQISFMQKIWHIPVTKNNDPVIVALSSDAIKILKKRQNNGSEFVFPGEGELGHIIEPRRAWRRILKRAGITNLRLHDLRRTLGSWQAITGSTTLIIGKSLGHKSQQATAVYARLNLDPVRKSIETATTAMLKASKRKGNKRNSKLQAHSNSGDIRC